jgi:protein-S-isoprenylcysteine O-methyltransferase Ste14
VTAPHSAERQGNRVADWLYRHRGSTAVPFAIVAVVGADPTVFSILVGGFLIALGESLRLKAAATIGPHSRGLSLRAPELVMTGPYAFLRHPLYMGNLIVSTGVLVLSRSFLPWLPLVFGPAFLIQYTLFVRREERFLAERFGAAWVNYAARVPAFVGGSAWRALAGAVPLDRDTLRLEWPTLRTILGLLLLIGLVAFLRN